MLILVNGIGNEGGNGMKSNTHTYTHRKTERESDDGQREWKMYDQIL